MDQIKEAFDISSYAEDLYKDPVKLGFLIHALFEERKKTNQLCHKLLEKLEGIEARLGGDGLSTHAKGKTVKEKREHLDNILLSPRDKKILEYVKGKKVVCADDVAEAFHYSKQNGASARLNSLEKQGLLEKKQVGKKVFFQTN